MEPILSVEHLSVTFTRYGRGLNRVELNPIRDLSLAVEPGRVTAVVGESGSGKSLLAHAVFYLLPQNARVGGTLRYDGAPLTREVGDQLRRGQGGRAVRDRCRAALERYGLGLEVEELYPFQLSGGMARRVLIACAVADRPRLIVADEPTPGLDIRGPDRGP